ncbi:MAG: D-2-hydroxyacid dehydrogenase [Oscillospiraceae bacterium]|jgi:glycerate dehydrogenase|nr:D-2-hydroxyacid dehydrogenase [Oscillospiraceae bacterium]
MRIVILDAYTTNPGDLSWDALKTLGDVTIHDRTPDALIVPRAKDAEILINNKTILNAEVLRQLPKLRYIGLLSTGYNVVDLNAARALDITVTNIPAYSTPSVAQMVFALLLELCVHAGLHSHSVRRHGDWTASQDFCYWKTPQTELSGKTLGIVGYGRIGEAVASIANAFGMRVLACKSPRNTQTRELTPNIRLCAFDEVLANADVLTLHCPLFPETTGLIRNETIAKMKRGALLINTSRGAVLNEQDVAAALADGRLGGLGADVLSTEPPQADNPLLAAPNCVITPHIAWATKEARGRLVDILIANLTAFLNGNPQNTVS